MAEIEVDGYYKKQGKEMTDYLFDNGLLDPHLTRTSLDVIEDLLGFMFQSHSRSAAKCAVALLKIKTKPEPAIKHGASTPGGAIEVLSEDFKANSGFARSWHAKITMICYDVISGFEIHGTDVGDRLYHEDALKIGQAVAELFMRRIFGVETNQAIMGEQGEPNSLNSDEAGIEVCAHNRVTKEYCSDCGMIHGE